jgi:hypothetical protein
MSSWGPGFVQKKGPMHLAYYHFVGFESFAAEYFKLIRSVIYTQNINEFLFVFDKVNSVSVSIGLFEYTLKKNDMIRFLLYYPTSGFHIGDRKDLLEPALQKRSIIPNVPNFFSIFVNLFKLQDKIRQAILQLYEKKEIPISSTERLGLCLHESVDFKKYFEKLKHIPMQEPSFNLFLSGTRDQCESFKSQCPSKWIIYSMWDTLPSNIVTEEQKMDVYHASLGSLICLENCESILGSFHDPVFRFLYCKEGKFRDPKRGIVLDSSSFSFF